MSGAPQAWPKLDVIGQGIQGQGVVLRQGRVYGRIEGQAPGRGPAFLAPGAEGGEGQTVRFDGKEQGDRPERQGVGNQFQKAAGQDLEVALPAQLLVIDNSVLRYW